MSFKCSHVGAVCAPVIFATLTACGSTPSAESWPQHFVSERPPQSQCNAEAARFLERQSYTQDSLERAMYFSGADEARLLRVSQPITKEYRYGRVNLIVTDDLRTILRVRCG